MITIIVHVIAELNKLGPLKFIIVCDIFYKPFFLLFVYMVHDVALIPKINQNLPNQIRVMGKQLFTLYVHVHVRYCALV